MIPKSKAMMKKERIVGAITGHPLISGEEPIHETRTIGKITMNSDTPTDSKIADALRDVEPKDFPLSADHPATKALGEAKLRKAHDDEKITKGEFDLAMEALERGEAGPALKVLGISDRAARSDVNRNRTTTGTSKSVRRRRSEKKAKRAQRKKSKRKNR